MKINKDFRLRSIAGEYMLIHEGNEHPIDFEGVLTFNEPAAFLWGKAKGKVFTEDDLVAWLLEEYEVDEPVAREDVAAMLEVWRQYNLVFGE